MKQEYYTIKIRIIIACDVSSCRFTAYTPRPSLVGVVRGRGAVEPLVWVGVGWGWAERKSLYFPLRVL